MHHHDSAPYVKLRMIDWLKLSLLTIGPMLFSLHTTHKTEVAMEIANSNSTKLQVTATQVAALNATVERLAEAMEVVVRHDERITELQSTILEMSAKLDKLQGPEQKTGR